MPPPSGNIYINSPEVKKEKLKDQLNQNLSDAEKKLDELIHRSGLLIYEISSSQPIFPAFRDRLIISANRITLIKRGIFFIDEYPMQIENLTDAFVYTHFLFSSLTIETFGIPKPPPLKYLKPMQARLARRYILALIECKKANIDLSGLNPDEVREKLKLIGTVNYGSINNKYHKEIL